MPDRVRDASWLEEAELSLLVMILWHHLLATCRHIDTVYKCTHKEIDY